MSLMLGVVTYKPASDSSAKVRAYRAVERGRYTLPATSSTNPPYVTLGLNTSFAATGGPVEIGVSVPIESGSYQVCRPIVDGAPLTSGEPDDFTYGWHDGIVYSSAVWQQWDRIRVYRNIPAGSRTLGVQCRNESGTGYAGHAQMVSTVWAVVYDP
jgi:hypothetical protein